MATKDKKVVASVALRTNRPTKLSFDDLYTWVIWQFPRKKEGGLCAAVHPPVPNHGWLPALIQLDKKRLHVYAHLEQTFETPEEAVDYFNHTDDP